MTLLEQKSLNDLLDSLDLSASQKEKLNSFVDEVEENAFKRGQESAQSAFDGTHLED